MHTLALAWASHVHTLALARADFGLGRATLASEKKKKKVSRNLLKFCMEAYKLILSTSAKNGRKIRKNEVFSLVLRFRPWPCAHFGLGMGSRVHTLALAWADFGLGRATLASEKKKEKVSRNLLKFCMEAYKPILSTSAKNGRKIR